MSEAMEIMQDRPKRYMVSFEYAGDGFLRSDHFPDMHAGEELIQTETEAWELARRFAAKTKGRCVNIFVTDSRFCPVEGYQTKFIKNR